MKELFSQLNSFLSLHKAVPREGHVGMSGRALDLVECLPLGGHDIHIGQSGFNVGHSALAILHSCPSAKVVSFQLLHPTTAKARKSVEVGAAFVEMMFPGRHIIVLGRS